MAPHKVTPKQKEDTQKDDAIVHMHCICGKIHPSGTVCAQCEKCDEWYYVKHFCLGLRRGESIETVEFFCNACRDNNEEEGDMKEEPDSIIFSESLDPRDEFSITSIGPGATMVQETYTKKSRDSSSRRSRDSSSKRNKRKAHELEVEFKDLETEEETVSKTEYDRVLDSLGETKASMKLLKENYKKVHEAFSLSYEKLHLENETLKAENQEVEKKVHEASSLRLEKLHLENETLKAENQEVEKKVHEASSLRLEKLNLENETLKAENQEVELKVMELEKKVRTTEIMLEFNVKEDNTMIKQLEEKLEKSIKERDEVTKKLEESDTKNEIKTVEVNNKLKELESLILKGEQQEQEQHQRRMMMYNPMSANYYMPFPHQVPPLQMPQPPYYHQQPTTTPSSSMPYQNLSHPPVSNNDFFSHMRTMFSEHQAAISDMLSNSTTGRIQRDQNHR